jgi:hydroxyacylglutathione hydrolase
MKCLRAAKDEGWTITQILNTHEHRDHTGGNGAMVRKTRADSGAQEPWDKIGGMARGLSAGDVVKVGKTVGRVLDTPGHTMCHACGRTLTSRPCGDTLFNAGAGNLTSGHPEELYKTFDQQLTKLPPSTLFYPGHDYMENNLRFTLDREPDSKSARKMLDKLASQDLITRTYRRSTSKGRSTRSSPDQPNGHRELRRVLSRIAGEPDQRTVF